MDFKKIKTEAKEKINGHLWDVWKPIIVIAVLSSIISLIIETVLGPGTTTTVNENAKTFSEMLSSIKTTYNYPSMISSRLFSLLLVPASVGSVLYMLNFVRGKEYSLDNLKAFYPKIGIIIALNIVMSVLIGLGYIALLIPGIILTFAYSMTFYIFADHPDLSLMDYLRKSREMMKGYKFNYFAFSLSFIGWILLCFLIIPIIWVVPYIETSMTIYYDELKKSQEVE